MAEYREIRPQPGYQEKILSCEADIAISGAAAGVGKTFALLIDPLRAVYKVPGFGGVIFRRTTKQIRNEGGLWDTSVKLYPIAKGKPKETFLEWEFGENKIAFSHLEHEKNIIDWQGAQIPYIGFDELPHFSKKMFFYLLTRNRSTCGVTPYVRATCNPDPESWVAEFIEWWIDQETGFPIPERDGVIRYLIIDGENCIWGDNKDEVIDRAGYILKDLVSKSGLQPEVFVKSVTFISGSIYDNKELLSINPGYLANLLSQDEATKRALLDGNWKVVLSDDDLYRHSSFSGVFTNTFSVPNENKYITADIALKGADKFVVGVWYGFELVDLLLMDKSDGKQVIDSIVGLAIKHKVPNENICYDNDGVGGFVDGFISGSKPFNNGGKTINGENYENLKTQCYYKSSDRSNSGGYKVSADVADRMYDDKMTVRQRFMHERKAIKRDKKDMDGKLKIIPKARMKAILGGQSPDLMDMYMMREYFELMPQSNWVAF